MDLSGFSSLSAYISGLDLSDHAYDMGEGISLCPAFARLFAPFMMALEPASQDNPYGAPWKATQGGISLKISAELDVPENYGRTIQERLSAARTITSLLRIGVNPAIRLSAISSVKLSQASKSKDSSIYIYPLEVNANFAQFSANDDALSDLGIEWVISKWPVAHSLKSEEKSFATALEALDSVQFVREPALALLSIWGALEAIFSPARSELRFRISSLIASFLLPPGIGRRDLQLAIARNYDKRSGAAHGQTAHDLSDLVEAANLLVRVIVSIIANERVPSHSQLQDMLFGVDE